MVVCGVHIPCLNASFSKFNYSFSLFRSQNTRSRNQPATPKQNQTQTVRISRRAHWTTSSCRKMCVNCINSIIRHCDHVVMWFMRPLSLHSIFSIGFKPYSARKHNMLCTHAIVDELVCFASSQLADTWEWRSESSKAPTLPPNCARAYFLFNGNVKWISTSDESDIIK